MSEELDIHTASPLVSQEARVGDFGLLNTGGGAMWQAGQANSNAVQVGDWASHFPNPFAPIGPGNEYTPTLPLGPTLGANVTPPQPTPLPTANLLTAAILLRRFPSLIQQKKQPTLRDILNEAQSASTPRPRRQSSSPVQKTFRIVSVNSGLCVDVVNSTNNTAKNNGTPVQQYRYAGLPNQQWRFEAVGHGWYKIVSVGSGKCLDVTGASSANGARVQQWDDNGGANQQWQPLAVSKGIFKLKNRASNKVLDLTGASKQPMTLLQQWDDNGGVNQQWQLVPV